MKRINNTTGSKSVNITTDATGNVRAMYVQNYNGEEQVLQSKSFASVRNAERWANKMLAQINLAEYDQEHQSEYDNEQWELDQVQQEYD